MGERNRIHVSAGLTRSLLQQMQEAAHGLLSEPEFARLSDEPETFQMASIVDRVSAWVPPRLRQHPNPLVVADRHDLTIGQAGELADG